ncbi:MAG: hypothetical protein WD426_12935 [Anditalea sp.]
MLHSFKKVTGISFAILLLLVAAQVKAQDNNPGPKFGIKGGVNLS